MTPGSGLCSKRRPGTKPPLESAGETTALLAVQGPDAPAAIETVLEKKPGRFRLIESESNGHPVGWPGPVTPASGEEKSPCLLLRLLVCLRPFRRRASHGRGRLRDTLRLEMGYPLWGQDLDPQTTPLEAGLGWVVDWDHDFVGKAALEAQRDGGRPETTDWFRDGRASDSPAAPPVAGRCGRRRGDQRQLQSHAQAGGLKWVISLRPLSLRLK